MIGDVGDGLASPPPPPAALASAAAHGLGLGADLLVKAAHPDDVGGEPALAVERRNNRAVARRLHPQVLHAGAVDRLLRRPAEQLLVDHAADIAAEHAADRAAQAGQQHVAEDVAAHGEDDAGH